jgi:predicted lactoylglutathione lyase
LEQRISLVTLGGSDLNRSISFYEGLGWERSVRAATRVAFFQMGGMAFGLYSHDKLAEDAKLPGGGSGFGGVAMAQNARSKEEVDQILAEAVAAGGKLLKPAEEVFWGGYSGYFADPDGNPWEIAWNPSFEILEDGSIRLPD